MDYYKKMFKVFTLCTNKCYYYSYIHKFRDEDGLR